MQVKGLLFVFVMLLSGCASVQDFHYEATNALRSQIAWYHAAPNVRQGLCPSDYGKGWKLGYYAVTTGGGCQPPSFPPTCYWSAHYQSLEGQADIAAWYRGYQDGAMRAERRGAGSFHYFHAHDDGSYGGDQVIVTTPESSPPEPPPIDSESIPPGNTSIHHSDPVSRKSVRETGASARTTVPSKRSARVQAARQNVQDSGLDNVSQPGQSIEPPSAVPADFFPGPSSTLSPETSTLPELMQPSLIQPPSIQPAEAAPAFGAIGPVGGSGIAQSSWTTVQNEPPRPAASTESIRQVRRLPPVLQPLFGPPAQM